MANCFEIMRKNFIVVNVSPLVKYAKEYKCKRIFLWLIASP